jgi:predicted unusual protein kinase regulating ubiquinone biosynthesis (AarF/ABC1/UbiB family)
MNVFRNVFSLMNVSFDIVYETSRYYLFGDRQQYIERLANKLSQKNILYIKIFQACALNNNIFPEGINNSLIKFTDNAPWTEDDIDMDTLCRFETLNQVRIENKDKPLKSGMISLIYKGRDTITNEEVILKLKRKNIAKKLEEGIAQLLFFLKLVNWIPFINTYDLPNIIHNNIDLIRHQTNFEEEVKNIQTFTTVCAKLKFVKIPKVYPEVTQEFPDLIMMEYMKGVTIDKVDKADYDVYAKQLLKFALPTMLLTGRCHGDLHVGNILFLKDIESEVKYNICLLDFGIIYQLTDCLESLFDIFTDMCSLTTDIIAKKILFSGLIQPLETIQSLSAEQIAPMLKIIDGFVMNMIHVEKRLSPTHICKFLTDLNAYVKTTQIKAFKLKASTDLVKFKVVFGMLHGVLLTLCGDNYIELTDKVMKETFHL